MVVKAVHTAQCADDSEVRNAFEQTPYVVVLLFHVFILISKSFNFRSSLDRILRYLTKTWFYTLNFKKKSMLMTQYRLLSYRKWLSIRYWVRYLNIWNVVANNSEQGIYVASANIYHHRTGGNVPWWPGCTPAEFLPYDSVFNTESLQIAQYRILSHKRYWVIILQYQHIVQCC